MVPDDSSESCPMPALPNVLLCAVTAAVFWTLLGLPLAQLFVPERALRWAVAPTLGWAVFNALALPILLVCGFTRISITLVVIAAVAPSLVIAFRRPFGTPPASASPNVPWWAVGAAALLAVAPAIAILPKLVDGGVLLTPQMYDHSKIAIIDDIVRLGLPVGNPFFGATPSHLVYYYLWHFGAAVLAKLLGISGWEADVAMTWFTAYASLILMMGLAIHFSGRRIAALWVALLSTALSLRPLLSIGLGQDAYNRMLSPDPGLQGWMLQATWSPQHLAGATCVILAVFMISRLSEQRSRLLCPALALVAAAGFESSTWIGGVTFAVAAVPVGFLLLIRADRGSRRRFVTRAAIAAMLVLAITAPFIRDQYMATAARQAEMPIGFRPYEVLGVMVTDPLRRILDLPAYWFILLVVEFPAIYITGSIVLARSAFGSQRPSIDKDLAIALCILSLVGFCITWLFISTIMNNDLGWRAVLPGVLVLTIFASVGLSHWVAKPVSITGAVAIVLLLLGLPDGLMLMMANARGIKTSSAATFATTPELWEAVRRHSAPDERVANNPKFLADMVGWPIDISWALLGDRRSCYAGWDLARAFVPLPVDRIDDVEALFQRVFAGTASTEEIAALAGKFDCRLVVITAGDGAWAKDEFAADAHYRLVEERSGQWRLYRPVDGSPPPP